MWQRISIATFITSLMLGEVHGGCAVHVGCGRGHHRGVHRAGRPPSAHGLCAPISVPVSSCARGGPWCTTGHGAVQRPLASRRAPVHHTRHDAHDHCSVRGKEHEGMAQWLAPASAQSGESWGVRPSGKPGCVLEGGFVCGGAAGSCCLLVHAGPRPVPCQCQRNLAPRNRDSPTAEHRTMG